MQTADELIASYPAVFQREVGTLPGTVYLKVEQEATPVVAPPCWDPVSLKNKLEEELGRLQQLEEQGLKLDPAKVEAITKMPKPQDVEA